jgi:hypothetical protein
MFILKNTTIVVFVFNSINRKFAGKFLNGYNLKAITLLHD